MNQLRDYQIRAADAVEEAWNTHASTMVAIPTGGGKTVLFSELIRRRHPGRALVVAHREELIWQAKDKIERFTGLECEIEMGELAASSSLFTAMPVIVATVQTLVSGGKRKRMERFKPGDFSTLIIDEFHHATAASYRRVLDYFLQNPELKVLGVTATPDRADEEALGQVCQSVAFQYEMVEAIRDGWLVPVEQQMVSISGLDFSGVRTTAGDLNGADLAAVMESEENLHGLCSATLDIIGNRQTIVFTSSVKQAEDACAIFNRHRPGSAEWVSGKTEREARRKTMQAVTAGQTQILCNVGVATEGFDAPGIEVIVMGRPTKSRALYAQMAGRATRPLPGIVDGLADAEARRAAIAASAKPACLLVDFAGNSGKHKLITGADLLGGKYSDEVREKAREAMRKSGKRSGIAQCLDEAAWEIRAEAELRGRREAAERRRKEEEKRKARIVAKANYSATRINPFDAFDIVPIADGPRSGRALSEKQRSILVRQGINPDDLPYAAARQFIDEQFRRWKLQLCTLKQATLLKRYGYETHDMPMAEASRILTCLAINRWRPLATLPQDAIGPSSPESIPAAHAP